MLTLFTNITQELTELEKVTLVPIVLEILKQSSVDKRIYAHQMCILFRAKGHAMSDVRIRKMINYIRVTNLANPNVVIGTSKGYFLSSDLRVIDDQVESLRGRIDAQQAAIDAITAQRESLKHQQCNAS